MTEQTKKRRKRRTKAEIEAAKKAEQNKPIVKKTPLPGAAAKTVTKRTKDMKGDKDKWPKIIVEKLDMQGRMTRTVYTINPTSFQKYEDKVEKTTETGMPKTFIRLSVEGDVVEIN